MLVPDIVILFELDGKDHRLGFRDMPIGWWQDLKQQARFTPRSLILGLGEGDVESLVALIWLVRRQERSALTYSMVMDKLTSQVRIEIKDIIRDGESMMALAEDVMDESQDEPEEDVPPTSGASSLS